MQCLQCHGSRVAKGTVAECGSRGNAMFRPSGIGHFALTLTGGVSLPNEAWACLDCGLVWKTLSPAKLEKFLSRHCDSPDARRLVEGQPKPTPERRQ